MKKMFILLLAAITVLSFAACSTAGANGKMISKDGASAEGTSEDRILPFTSNAYTGRIFEFDKLKSFLVKEERKIAYTYKISNMQDLSVIGEYMEPCNVVSGLNDKLNGYDEELFCK